MRLALNLGYLSGTVAPQRFAILAGEAERLGYDCVWVAEAYGSDAPTLLAWLAAQTSRIGLGSAVMQIPARSPAMTAMTAATLSAVSAGRFRLGLGVSGPQVSEGWHGERFTAPLRRTREYVAVVRLALAGRRVEYAGTRYRLPLPDGPGKPLKLALRPPAEPVPVYLAAIGPENLRLAGEVADGWLGILCSPQYLPEQLAHIAEGRARTAADPAPAPADAPVPEPAFDAVVPAPAFDAVAPEPAFDAVASVPVVIGDDVAACAEAVRPYAALYVGGMGSRERNFYNDLVVRMGFPDAAREVREHYLAGRHRDAAAALPLELLDATSLLGPVDRIAAGLRRYARAGVTTLAALPMVSRPAGAAQATGGPPAAGLAAAGPAELATLRGLAEAFERAG